MCLNRSAEERSCKKAQLGGRIFLLLERALPEGAQQRGSILSTQPRTGAPRLESENQPEIGRALVRVVCHFGGVATEEGVAKQTER